MLCNILHAVNTTLHLNMIKILHFKTLTNTGRSNTEQQQTLAYIWKNYFKNNEKILKANNNS